MTKPDLEPDAAADFIVLHGRDCTAVLERADPGPPLWRYWGPRLPDGVLPEAALDSTRPLPSFSLDAEQPLSLFPLFGVGGFTAPALAAHRAGHDFAQAFTACEIVWTVPGQALVCRLSDAVAGLEVEVRMEMNADASTLTLGTWSGTIVYASGASDGGNTITVSGMTGTFNAGEKFTIN